MFRASLALVAAVVLLAAGSAIASSPCADSGIVTQLTEMDGSISDVQYVGKDHKKIFLLTDQRVVWRSPNEGLDWANMMDKMDGSKDVQDFFGSGVSKIVLSTADRDRVFIQGVGKFHWVTADAGRTFTRVGVDKPLTDVILHPTNPQLILASALNSKCYGDPAGDEMYCNRQLWLSTDFGASFAKKVDFVQGYQWGKGAEAVVYGSFPNGNNHQPHLNSRDAHLSFTRNLWKTQHQAKESVVGFKVINQHVYAATQDQDGLLALHESRDDGVTMTKLEFPEPLPQRRYVIFDDGSGGVDVSVMHGDDWGHVYASNGDTGAMVVILRDVPMTYSAHMDWVSVEHGTVVIANVAEKGMVGEGSSVKRTLISFDRGGHWQPLKKPTNVPCKDKDACSLHLHAGHKQLLSQHAEDATENHFGVILTKPNAAGIVLAVGNVGPTLERNPDAAHTLLSRDAGLTWVSVQQGTHVFDMGDHGGVIAMAKSYRATMHLHYNTQENTDYHSCAFTNSDAIDVADIITEPNGTSTSFLLYGRKKDKEGSVVVHFDFQGLMATPCKGVANAGEEGSDFELWSPSDGAQVACLNGETTTYTRRKPGVSCHYGAKYEKKKSIGPCQCTAEDFECNFCYERKKETTEFGQQGAALVNQAASSVPCVWSCKEGPVAPVPPEKCVGTYKSWTPYRKIANNKCKGGMELDVQILPCPGSGSTSSIETQVEKNIDTKSAGVANVQTDLQSSSGTALSGVIDKTDESLRDAKINDPSTPTGSSSSARNILVGVFLIAVVCVVTFFIYTNKSSQGGGWRLNLFGRGQYAYAKLTQRLDHVGCVCVNGCVALIATISLMKHTHTHTHHTPPKGDLMDDDDMDDDEDPVDALENAALASIGGRARGGLDCRVLG